LPTGNRISAVSENSREGSENGSKKSENGSEIRKQKSVSDRPRISVFPTDFGFLKTDFRFITGPATSSNLLGFSSILCGLQTLISKGVIASASEAISLLLLILVEK